MSRSDDTDRKADRTARLHSTRVPPRISSLLIALFLLGTFFTGAPARATRPMFYQTAPFGPGSPPSPSTELGKPIANAGGAVTLKALAAPIATAPTSTESTPEIEAMAAALRNDVDLIFEFVYNEVEHEVMWGSHNGAMGALLDRTGNSFDQASLLVALLRAAGHSARFVFGQIQLDGAETANWLEGEDDPEAVWRLFAWSGYVPTISEGVPQSSPQFEIVTSDGTWDGELAQAKFEHVWVEVDIDGTYYTFDPSLKSYTYFPALDLAAFTGYDEEAFLAAALEGSTAGTDFVQNINRENLEAELTTYSMNLVETIRQNHPSATLNEIIGGRKIDALEQAPRNTTHPNQHMIHETWEEIPDSYRSRVRFNYPVDTTDQIDWTAHTDTLSGKRITLFYTANDPRLHLDGEVVSSADDTANRTMRVSVDHPYGLSEGTYADSQSNFWVLDARNGFFTYILSSGSPGLAHRNTHLEQYRRNLAAGQSTLSDGVLGEAFTAQGLQWQLERALVAKIRDRMMRTVTRSHHQIIQLESTYDGVVMDATHVITPIPRDDFGGNNDTAGAMGSALEWGAFEQLTDGEGVSTVSLFGTANDQSLKFFDATAENWSSIEGMLTGYATLSFIKGFVDDGYRVILPERGDISTGSWTGYGYIVRFDCVGPWCGQGYLLSGYINGGFLTRILNSVTDFFRPMTALFGWISNTWRHLISLDPIDLYTGDFIYDHTDLSVGSGSTPFALDFQRSYNAGDRHRSAGLGKGWKHNFDIRAEVESDSLQALLSTSPVDNAAAIVAGFVAAQLALRSPNADETPLSDILVRTLVDRWLMDEQIDNVVTLLEPDVTEHFVKLPDGSFNPPAGSASVLSQEEDGSYLLTTKHGVALEFNTDGQIESLQDPNGNTLSFAYANERLQSVSNSVGRRFDLSYYTDNSPPALEGALQRVSDETGRSVRYFYDDDGNLESFEDAEGHTTRFEYEGEHLLARIYHPSHPDNPSVSNTFDEAGRVATQTDALGNLWTYHFAGHRTEEINPLGHSKIWYFDSNGNATREIDAQGFETRMEFDGAQRLIRKTLPDGRRLEYAYDARNNRIRETLHPTPGSEEPPLVSERSYESTWNRVTSSTDPRGFTTTYGYDERGNLVGAVLPAVEGGAPSVAMTRNARGQVTAATDPLGTVTAYAYSEPAGQLETVTLDPGGLALQSSFVYDAVGNVISQTNPRGNIMGYGYDAKRNPTFITAPAPFFYGTRNVYDEDGFLRSVSRQADETATTWQTTQFTINTAGLRDSATDPEGNTTSIQYDALGRAWRVTDALGQVRETLYDARGQVSQVIDSGGVLEASFTYTETGQVASLSDANDNATLYQYDGFRRLEKTVYADGSFESLRYDAASNVVSRQTRAGDLLLYTYDALGRLVTKEVPGTGTTSYRYDHSGRLIDATGTTGTTQHSYDAVGRLVQVDHATGHSVRYEYDAGGNRTRIETPSGRDVLYGFDALGRVTSAQVSGLVQPATYGYDPLSRRTSLNHPLGGTTHYGWEIDNDVSWQQYDGAVRDFRFDHSYDARHRRVTTQASDTAFNFNFAENVRTDYASNPLNQYVRAGTATPTYDANGNLRADGTNTYVHDAEGRLVSVTTPEHSVQYAYDALGRRTHRSVDGVVTVTVYDGLQALEAYDAAGEWLHTVSYGGGMGDPLVFSDRTADYGYHLDAQGSVVALANGAGTFVEIHAYGPFGETAPASAVGNPLRYTGQAYDATTGVYDYRARNYHPGLGRFLEPDPIGPAGGIHLYAYVGGDPINFIDPLGLSRMDAGQTKRLQLTIEEDAGLPSGGGGGTSQVEGSQGVDTGHNADFSGIQNFNPVKFGVGAVNTARGLTRLAAGTVTLGTSAGASTVVGPLALPGTAVGTAQLAFGAANLSRGTQQIHESFNDPAGPSFRNLLGVLPFGQEFDDPLEPLPQDFAAQRLRGLTTSPIATGLRLFYEFFAFGPNDSGAGP